MDKTRRGFFGALVAVVAAHFVPRPGAMPVKFVLATGPDLPAKWNTLEIVNVVWNQDDDRAFDFNHANENPTLYIHL